MQQFKVLSLFDGISCGQVALHRAGIKPTLYMSSEVERSAISCTQSNFPQTVQLGDVVKVREMAEAGLFGVGDIDLLMGGSPCQGFSNAGAGLGFDDPRSKLFFEFVRIKNAIKPKRFLLENVKMRKEWLDLISLYVGVDPVFINSADFCAAKRPRYYWTDVQVLPWVKTSIGFGSVIENDAPLNDYSQKAFNFLMSRKGKPKFFHKNSLEKFPCLEASMYKGYSDQRLFAVIDNNRMRYVSVTECERLQTLPDGYTHTQ